MWTGIEGRPSGQSSFLCISSNWERPRLAWVGREAHASAQQAQAIALFFKNWSQYEGFGEAMISGLESLGRAGLVFF